MAKTKNDGWDFLKFAENVPRINWNPITGCPNMHTVIKTKKVPELKYPAQYKSVVGCATPDGCSYCYEAAYCNRFPAVHKPEFRFHEERMGQIAKLKKPHIVVVGSAGDMWAYSSEHPWETEEVLSVCKNNPMHFYVFLTRDPAQYYCYDLPDNCLCGVTVTQITELRRIRILRSSTLEPKFVIFEPCFLTEQEASVLPEDIFSDIDWIVIGGLTGGKKTLKEQYRVKYPVLVHLFNRAKKSGTAIYLKNSIEFSLRRKMMELIPQISSIHPMCISKWWEVSR